MHARTQIRRAAAALLANLQSTGDHVYPSRVFSLDEAQLPSWSVLTPNESVARITMGPPVRYHRDLELVLEGHAIADDRVDEVLDQMAVEAEVAMSAAFVVDGRALSTQLISTEFSLSGDGEAQVGVVRLTYTIPYSTLETTPESLG